MAEHLSVEDQQLLPVVLRLQEVELLLDAVDGLANG